MRGDRTSLEIDELLQRMAARQLGLVTVDQAARAGVDKYALARRRKSGALIPVFSTVMRLAATPASPHQHVLASALAVPGSVIAGPSAALVHQMPLPGRQRNEPQCVLSVGPERYVTQPGIRAVRQSVVPPSRRWMTSRVTSPEATLLLLPRFTDAGVVERCLDDVLARRTATVHSIRKLLDTMPITAVSGRKLLLELLDARSSGIGHRSGKEQSVGRWLDQAGLRGWQRNYKVLVGEDEVEVDFAWEPDRVALEVSPFFTHGSRVTQERDAQRRRLLVEHDWRVVEATDRDLKNRAAFARSIASLRILLGSSGPELL